MENNDSGNNTIRHVSNYERILDIDNCPSIKQLQFHLRFCFSKAEHSNKSINSFFFSAITTFIVFRNIRNIVSNMFESEWNEWKAEKSIRKKERENKKRRGMEISRAGKFIKIDSKKKDVKKKSGFRFENGWCSRRGLKWRMSNAYNSVGVRGDWGLAGGVWGREGEGERCLV